MTKPDMLATMDVAAAQLLELAGLGQGSTPADGPDLAERVKAFQSVAAWMERRQGLQPVEKKESKFDGLKSQFHSTPAERGRNRSAKKAVEPGAAEPAGANLFAGEDGADV